ncbi:AI-2E family transporter [Sphingobacterium spiritivorum]|uniref:AI-2E family transporter n=1 Tax=Sphingobacterium spiritivorum TaxID=258 RepID=UPI00191AA977|nr:AI-2E family transporter [Sphingobacterium spiritivorum]QQT26602.1 AI-2E family transporter [Sphingobacterium spiritivorum]
MRKFISLPFYIKLACILISIVILGYLAKIGDTIIVPLILGILFAMLLTPISTLLERKLRFPRTLAGIVCIVLFFGGLATGLYLLASQLSMLQEDWPAFKHQILDGVEVVQDWVNHQFGIQYNEQMNLLNKTASKSVDSGTLILGTALMSLSSIAIFLVFTFLYTFFILIYRGHIVRFLLYLNAKEDHPIVLEIVAEVQYVVKRYLIGLLLQMLIVTTLVYIALAIIGVKYSLLLAIITGVFNVLPYIGIFSSMFIVALITFATSTFSHVLFVFVAMSIIHMIDSNVIVPKVVGSKVKINSLFAMMAIVCGELIWGISGMFLAIPLLAIVKIVMDRVDELKPWGFLLGEEKIEK